MLKKIILVLAIVSTLTALESLEDKIWQGRPPPQTQETETETETQESQPSPASYYPLPRVIYFDYEKYPHKFSMRPHPRFCHY